MKKASVSFAKKRFTTGPSENGELDYFALNPLRSGDARGAWAQKHASEPVGE